MEFGILKSRSQPIDMQGWLEEKVAMYMYVRYILYVNKHRCLDRVGGGGERQDFEKRTGIKK